ncbi:uncharacterized protein LOC129560814 [Moschus berezovskii]|uniref:uncharacterized protein LOC129560814 n=1 Tax=Moschus berezovskii TaxID=68408 RepID=UPI0024449B30|nr:uncharacterized protein LOC129560814 [Moschus berezovskii]
MPSLLVEYCSNSYWSLIDDPWQKNRNVGEHQRDPCSDKCTAFGTILDSSLLMNQLSIVDVVGLNNVKPPTGSFPFYQPYVGYERAQIKKETLKYLSGLGRREPDATRLGESPGQREAGAPQLADTQTSGRRRRDGGRRRPGGQKPPVLGPRASDAGKCPHPGTLQGSAAAATPSERQNGGGGGGLVLRGEPGPRDLRDGPRWPAAAPRRLCPPCPLGDTWGPPGRAPAASAPALGPVAAVQEPRCAPADCKEL